MKERVSLLLGDVSNLLMRQKTLKKRRKRVNVAKLMRDFQKNMPAEVFSEIFNQARFFKSFNFNERTYPHTMILLLEYVDKAVVATTFLIWEKKDCLVQLMTKIMGVSRSLSSAHDCLHQIRSRFDYFVQEKAAGFIGRRNAQMKRMRLEVYLEHLEWLRSMRGKIGKLMVYIARERTDGLFQLYEETRTLFEKKAFNDMAWVGKIARAKARIELKNSVDHSKRFSFNEIKESKSLEQSLQKAQTLTPKDLFPKSNQKTPKKINQKLNSLEENQENQENQENHENQKAHRFKKNFLL